MRFSLWSSGGFTFNNTVQNAKTPGRTETGCRKPTEGREQLWSDGLSTGQSGQQPQGPGPPGALESLMLTVRQLVCDTVNYRTCVSQDALQSF